MNQPTDRNTNAALGERRARAVPRGVATATPFFIQRAENAEVWDVEGRRLIDFATGIAVLNTGHRHPAVVEAVERQLQLYTHAAFQVMAYEPYVALAERLNAIAPVRGPAKTILFSTGAEAIENAIKIARVATKRSAIVAFSGAFHGRTLMALSLTGKSAPYKTGFGALPGDVYRVPFPIAHYGVSVQDSLRALDYVFRTDAAPDRVAAIVIEPVQGEGGFHPAPRELLTALRELCDTHGILLVGDEIQTGFARTGRMFALEHANVRADLLVAAKSLAGGLPLSAVIGNATIMDAPEPGGLGGTYAGSPLACAAALAVLDVIQRERLADRANELGDLARVRLAAMARQSDLQPIGHVRGLGSMIGFDMLARRDADEVLVAGAGPVTKRAHELGLVVLTCGTQGESIRLLFPLTASDEIVEEGLDLLAKALRAV
jgi:4-aminobutyrate aminotransferase / (S)-3-amino-2-methylpropionate transaminase / 5-aminovalerate transaminase